MRRWEGTEEREEKVRNGGDEQRVAVIGEVLGGEEEKGRGQEG